MIRKYKQYLLIGLIFFAACSPTDDSSPLPEDFFVKFYGNNSVEAGYDVLVTDTGYLVFGSTNSPELNLSDGEDSDFYLVFTDSQGNSTSEVVFGTDAEDIPSRIKPTSDGGYIVVGTTTAADSEHTDIIVYKLDANGAVSGGWPVTYGFVKTTPFEGQNAEDSNEEGYDIVETEDGDYVVLGTTNNVNTDKDNPNPTLDKQDIYLFKISSTEVDHPIIWERVTGFDNGNDQGRSLIVTNTGLAIMGQTNVDKDGAGTGTNILFLTTDEEGLDSQFKVFGTGDGTNETGSKMKKTSDGGVIIVGTASTGSINSSILMKVTANRTLTFFETLSIRELDAGGNRNDNAIINNFGYDVVELSTGGYLVVGKRTGGTLEGDPSGDDIYIIKTDSFGKIKEGTSEDLKEGLFEKKYGGSGNDQANAVVELPSGKLLIAGTNDFGGTNSTMMMLMKVNRNGELLR
ncbi:hypothetical protein [Reichenbachiella sp. MALMAid0571]|uniref:hypothetical protein n=1 Tax=Reichenbachiella sp. MALMAid0571 TaxID=3143939 RepID=UPI0032DEFFE1